MTAPFIVPVCRATAANLVSARAARPLQIKYVELIFGFMGFTDIRSVIVEPPLEQGPEVAQAKRQAALNRAREMAREF